MFDECPQWHVDRYNDYASKNYGVLHIIGSDPELLKEVPPDKMCIRDRFNLAPYCVMQYWRGFLYYTIAY